MTTLKHGATNFQQGLMLKPRIKRTTEFVDMPNGDVLLVRPSADKDARLKHPDARDREFLGTLDGRTTIEQLNDRFGKAFVKEALLQFEALGLLEDAADDDQLATEELERFDRQLRYFSDIQNDQLSPSECQGRLRDATVAVLGCGGLGGWSALALACVGIGEFWLVDGDRVETSNFNRQILFSPAELGLLKVECAAARLRTFDPGARVKTIAEKLEGEADIAEAISGCDFVIDAADWPPHDIERWCNAACYSAGIPYITMSHFPPIARVGPLFAPGLSGCYLCYERGFRSEFPDLEIVIEERRAMLNHAASLGPACGLIGSQVALEAMHLLTGLATPATLGRSHIYDLRTMEVTHHIVIPETGCPVCGHLDAPA